MMRERSKSRHLPSAGALLLAVMCLATPTWAETTTPLPVTSTAAGTDTATETTPVPDSTLQESWTTAASSTQKREEPSEDSDQDAKEQHQVAILKQINRVNDDGSYTFGYEAADGSFKIETRDVRGHVKGMFGFIDEHGQLKRVSYTAANGTGFQAAAGAGAARSGGSEGTAPTPSDRPVIRPSPRRPVLVLRRPAQQDNEEVNVPTPRIPDVIQQIPRHTRPPATVFPWREPSLTSTSTALPPTVTPRRPVIVLSTPSPQPDGSTPTPAPYGQFVRRVALNDSAINPGTVLVLAGAPSGRRVLVTRRPDPAASTRLPVVIPTAPVVEETTPEPQNKEGNDLRRQLSSDRDIDPSGLIPAGGRLLRLRQPGSSDAGDVYGGAGTGQGALPAHGALPARGAPHVGILQSQAQQAIQSDQLQKHILGDVDLTPRPRYPEHADAVPSYLGRARQLPPLQLEPNVAKALEQFLLSRGIRLRPLDPARDPYLRPHPAPEAPLPAPAPAILPAPHRYSRPPARYHPMAYRGYHQQPYYEDDGYDYDEPPHYTRHSRPAYPYPRPYMYDPAYDPVYQPAYQPRYQPPYQPPYQPLFVPLRPYSRRVGAAAPPPPPEQHVDHQAPVAASSSPVQYAEVALPEDLRQELLFRMLLGARAQVQSQDYDSTASPTSESTTLPSVTRPSHFVTTSTRVRNVKILEPEQETSPTTVRPTVTPAPLSRTSSRVQLSR